MSDNTLDIVFTPHTDTQDSWLDKQKNIHANEQRFFNWLIEGGYKEAACIYTLHMSNPPALEEVMKVTGLGKTTIYNKLKLLRAIEKTDSPDYYVSINEALVLMCSVSLVLDAIDGAISAVKDAAKVVGSKEERADILDIVNETIRKVEDGREKERQLDIKFNPISDEAFNTAKDGVTAKVLVDGKDVEDLKSYRDAVAKIKRIPKPRLGSVKK